jgi:hypothetical protein
VSRLGKILLERHQEDVGQPLEELHGRQDLSRDCAVHAPTRVICRQPRECTPVVLERRQPVHQPREDQVVHHQAAPLSDALLSGVVHIPAGPTKARRLRADGALK